MPAFFDAPPVTRMRWGGWPMKAECRRIDSACASTTARAAASASLPATKSGDPNQRGAGRGQAGGDLRDEVGEQHVAAVAGLRPLEDGAREVVPAELEALGDLLARQRAVGEAAERHEAARRVAEHVAVALRVGARAPAIAANIVSLVPRLTTAVPGSVAPMPTRLDGLSPVNAMTGVLGAKP